MAVVIMMFSTVSALAAADYYTTTTYNLTTGEVTVKTTVTDVTAKDEIAYIAYKGADPKADDAIFYIDQKTAEEGNNVFEYTTDAANIAESHVMLVGTSSAGKLSNDQTTAIKYGTDYELTVVVNGGTVTLTEKSNASNVSVTNETKKVSVGNGNVITYGLAAADGYDAANPAISLVDADGAEIVHEDKTFTVAGAATLTVTFTQTKTETAAVKENEVNASEMSKVAVENITDAGNNPVEAEAITKFGSMTIGTVGPDKYGIELSEDANFSTENTSVFEGKGTWDELKAQTGKFAIVIEGVKGEFDGTYYIRTFVTVGENTTYGKVFKYVDGVVSINE